VFCDAFLEDVVVLVGLGFLTGRSSSSGWSLWCLRLFLLIPFVCAPVMLRVCRGVRVTMAAVIERLRLYWWGSSGADAHRLSFYDGREWIVGLEMAAIE
jgi:hypothetical protein